MAISTEDLQKLATSAAVRKEMRERMDELGSLKTKHGGTLAAAGEEDAGRIRELAGELEELGSRFDSVAEAEAIDGDFMKLETFMKAPDPEAALRHGAAKKKRAARDIGGLFLESEAWKGFKENGTKDANVELPIDALWPGYQGIGEVPLDGLTRQAALFDSADYPIQPDFISQPVEVLYQANNIGPLFAQGSTNSNTVRYPVETVTATGATELAEGGTKPEADITFAPVDEPIRKIAVLLPLTDEALEDVPFLRSYMNARLRLFVQMREDQQLLTGNGTAPNIRGILNRSGINTTAAYSIGGANPDQALIDQVFVAAMAVYQAFLEPTEVILKPTTWQIAALAKDAQRNYLLGGPGAVGYVGVGPASSPRLWGLRVVLNANMPAQGTGNKVALVGAFRAGAMLIRRSGIDLAVSDSHSTFFAENKVALRAEERVGLAVFRPAAFAVVTSNA